MSYDGRVHTVQIGDLTRDLPIFEVAPGVKIAIFNMLGDTAVVEMAATILAKRLPTTTDVFIVPEVKAIPLGHALSVQSGLPYVVARKVRKPYMVNCLEVEVLSITTGKPQAIIAVATGRQPRSVGATPTVASANERAMCGPPPSTADASKGSDAGKGIPLTITSTSGRRSASSATASRLRASWPWICTWLL